MCQGPSTPLKGGALTVAEKFDNGQFWKCMLPSLHPSALDLDRLAKSLVICEFPCAVQIVLADALLADWGR